MKPQPYILAIALMVLLAGCAASPEARWAQQRQALTSANNLFVEVVEAGIIGDRETVLIGQSLQLASAYLAEASTDLPDGGERFDRLLNMVDGILAQVQRDLRNARREDE